MEELERLKNENRANQEKGKEIAERYSQRMNKNKVAFDAIFHKIWEIEPREEKSQNPFASQEDITMKAIKEAGFEDNKEVITAFLQHEKDYKDFTEMDARGLELGFKIASLSVCRDDETNTKKDDEWRFYPISIIAPQQMQEKIIRPMIEADAIKGEGLFANSTNIPLEDEEEDEFLMIEAYNCNASMSGYWQELKVFGVIGTGKTDGFLPYQFKQCLLQLLKEVATYIKNNTDAPSKAKNKVTNTLKALDKLPVWGLFFQILLLQGLCRWLENLDIDEKDPSIKEAQLFYNWLCIALAEKEMKLCFVPYGDEDKERLKPLCSYLYTTEIGKAVQEHIFGKPQPEVAQQEIEKSTKESKQTFHPIDNKKKSRGRPSKPFNFVLVGEEEKKKATLNSLHQLMKDKTNSKAVLYIKVAINMGLIQKPTYTQFVKEFGQIASKSIYNKYVTQNLFSDDEIKGAKHALTNAQ